MAISQTLSAEAKEALSAPESSSTPRTVSLIRSTAAAAAASRGTPAPDPVVGSIAPTMTTAIGAVRPASWLMPRRTEAHWPVGREAPTSSASILAISSRRSWLRPYPTTSLMPWTVSVTCWVRTARAAELDREASKEAVKPRRGTMSSWSTTKGSAVIATSQDTLRPMTASTTTGVMAAETAGAKVWAKKTSMRSTSLVARDSRSPERDVALTRGERGMRERKICPRSSSSALKATRWPRNCSAYRRAALSSDNPAMTASTVQTAGIGAPIIIASPIEATA